MKYSLVNGERTEAQPGLAGQCPTCGSKTIAKCGDVKVHHWSHKGKRMCDPWWENETEWHRNWKNYFPNNWQERTHTAESGEKHIADVKTIKDWVIEFQHSHIKQEERNARNEFYQKLVWVVDGTRRKRDKSKFFESIMKVATVSNPESPVINIFKVIWDDCALLRDWLGNSTPVFFDFGTEEQALWCLLPQDSNGVAYVLEFLRGGFIAFHRNELIDKDFFSDIIKNFKSTVAGLDSHRQTPIQSQFRPRLPPSRARRSRRL